MVFDFTDLTDWQRYLGLLLHYFLLYYIRGRYLGINYWGFCGFFGVGLVNNLVMS